MGVSPHFGGTAFTVTLLLDDTEDRNVLAVQCSYMRFKEVVRMGEIKLISEAQ